jgi:C-terminal domain of 1-Cys peroxiredoxin
MECQLSVVHAQILRVIDSLQLTAKHSVATPVNWDHGQDVVIVPAVSDEAAKDKVLLLPHVSRELLCGNSYAWCRFGGVSHAQMLTMLGPDAVSEGLEEGRAAKWQGLPAADT